MDDATDGCKWHYAVSLLKEHPGRSEDDLNVANTFSACQSVDMKKLGRWRSPSATSSQSAKIAGYLFEIKTYKNAGETHTYL